MLRWLLIVSDGWSLVNCKKGAEMREQMISGLRVAVVAGCVFGLSVAVFAAEPSEELRF